MRRGRSTNTDSTLRSAAASVQLGGITKGDGETVPGPRGMTVTMKGPMGTVRTATVTDGSGKTIGTVHVNENCIVTDITSAR